MNLSTGYLLPPVFFCTDCLSSCVLSGFSNLRREAHKNMDIVFAVRAAIFPRLYECRHNYNDMLVRMKRTLFMTFPTFQLHVPSSSYSYILTIFVVLISWTTSKVIIISASYNTGKFHVLATLFSSVWRYSAISGCCSSRETNDH